jgi:hypothetical protein
VGCLIAALVLENDAPQSCRWRDATADELADLQDSICNANYDALMDPVGWGLIVGDAPSYAAIDADQRPGGIQAW